MTNNWEKTTLSSSAAAGQSGFAHAWRALRHRNFRLFMAGQSISITGSWMTRVATTWLVYRLTKSPMMLGAIGFAGQIPMFLLAPLAGVVVDRMDRRTLLIWTQVLSAAQALLLAALTLSHIITIPTLFALSVVQGAVNALDMPTRQAFFVRMVENRHDLSNAIAINSSMSNATRLVGPALAGLLIAVSNEGWCFLVDGISYLAVIASLLMMRMSRDEARVATTSSVTQLREGWAYVSNSVPIRSILLLFALVSLMGWPFIQLMPIFAVQVLHGGAHTLGFLLGCVGFGAIAAAVSMALRHSVRGLVRQLPLSAFLFGGALICFGLSRWLWLSLLLMCINGFGMIQGVTGSNTILQTLVDEKMRGRVMSYYSMALVGMTPFGSLLAGAMANAWGAPRAVMVSGSACILGGLWFWLRLGRVRRDMRPIYERLGIIPEAEISVAEGPEN